MTATAAAPAFGPIVVSALRAQPQAANDRFAFAAVLDSLPGGEAKAGSSVDGDQSPTSNEPKQRGASPGQPDFQSILSSLPFAFLPASAPHKGAAAAEASPPTPASTLGLRPEDDGASNIAGADPANPAAVGRLVGERAFHLSLPTVGPPAFAPTAASSQGAGAPIGPSSLAPLAMQGQGLVGEGAPSAVGVASALAPSWSKTSAFAPTAASSQGAGAPIGPSSLAPLAMQGQGLVGEGAPIGPSSLAPLSMQALGLVGEAAPSAVGAASAIASVGASRIGERVLLASLPSARSAAASPRVEAASSFSETSASAPIAPLVNGSSANPSASITRSAAQSPAHGGRKSEVAASPSVARTASSAASAPAEPSGKAADGPPDPTPSGVQSAAPGSAFGAAPSASLAQGPSFGSSDSPARAADIAPRASAPSAPRTTTAPPVKEIDVDLSPGGVEDASMTMRLAGDKLSVVIRAGRL